MEKFWTFCEDLNPVMVVLIGILINLAIHLAFVVWIAKNYASTC